MTFIADIDETTPLGSDNVSQGDNQIRQFKSDVKDSFPNVSGAVTVTHTQLNDVPNKLVSFNGRTATAAVPASGDYELGDANSIGLGDVDINSPTNGDILQYNSGTGNWENEASALSGEALYSQDANAAASTNANFAYMVTQEADSIPAALGAVTNSSANGIQFTAATDCVVTFNYSCYTPASASNEFAIVINGAGSTLPYSQANSAIVTRTNLGNQTRTSFTGTVLCANTDVVSLCHRVVTRTTPAEGILRITVRGV